MIKKCNLKYVLVHHSKQPVACIHRPPLLSRYSLPGGLAHTPSALLPPSGIIWYGKGWWGVLLYYMLLCGGGE